MNAFPNHALCPGKHRLDIPELDPIPMLFENPSTPLNWVVLALVQRIVEQLNRLANLGLFPGFGDVGFQVTLEPSICVCQLPRAALPEASHFISPKNGMNPISELNDSLKPQFLVRRLQIYNYWRIPRVDISGWHVEAYYLFSGDYDV